jgi:DNA-binding transcriptional regulator YiaG
MGTKNTAENAHKRLATSVSRLRRNARLTQEQLAKRSGVGLRFVREPEQGNKRTSRMDKVHQVLAYFGYHLQAVEDRETDV